MPPPVLKPHAPLPPVVVTRPEAEARVWAQALSRAGSAVQALPLMAFGPPSDAAALAQCREHWTEYAAVMWVSPQAVQAFGVADLILKGRYPLEWRELFAFESGAAASDSPQPAQASLVWPRCWAPGPGTARALRAAGVPAAAIDQPSAQAAQFDSEALWAVVAPQVQPGWRLLIVRGQSDGAEAPVVADAPPLVAGQGRDWLAERVRERGGVVHGCAAYARVCPVWTPEQHDAAQAALRDGAVWLFSSSEAVAHLARLMPQQHWGASRALATHPRIADAVATLGFGEVVRSRPSLADVTCALADMATA